MTKTCRIEELITIVDERNSDNRELPLLGINLGKSFFPSVANVIGTDLSRYKVIRRGRFACNMMHVGRDMKVPVALYLEDREAIISPAYPMFTVSDESLILPEYLMLFFKNSEFDREAGFYASAGIRGGFEWEDFCNIALPVPPISEQRRIVAEYQTVERRIKNNEAMIQKLEETAQAIYHHTFVEGIDENNLPEGWKMGTIKEFCYEMKSGGTPSKNEEEYWQNGTIPWLKTGEVNGIIIKSEEKITELGLKNSSAKFIEHDSVIIAMYGGGTLSNIGYLAFDTTTNQACCNMICHNKARAAFLYFHLKYHQEEIRRLANGGAQENLNMELISNLPIPISININYSHFETIIKTMTVLVRENSHLCTLQSLLTSRLA